MKTTANDQLVFVNMVNKRNDKMKTLKEENIQIQRIQKRNNVISKEQTASRKLAKREHLEMLFITSTVKYFTILLTIICVLTIIDRITGETLGFLDFLRFLLSYNG